MNGQTRNAPSPERFIGREGEMGILEALYAEDGFKACAVVGHRRMGKTTLLMEFCRDKPCLHFRFAPTSLASCLDHISVVLSGRTGAPRRTYADLAEAFDDVRAVCADGKTVIVLDNYHRLLGADPDASTRTCRLIDGLAGTGAMVVVCADTPSALGPELEDSCGLGGRMRAVIEVGPMPYSDCRRFHPGMDEPDVLRTYLTVGGVPMYHDRLRGPTYRDCVARHILRSGSLLAEEPEMTLTLELPSPGRHAGVLDAIAEGNTSLKEISEHSGIPKSTCSRLLDGLIDLGMAERLDIEDCAYPRYGIADGLTAFVHEVALMHRELEDPWDPYRTYDAMEGYIGAFLRKRFIRLCAGFVHDSYRTLAMSPGRDGGADFAARVREDGRPYDLLCRCQLDGSADLDAYLGIRGHEDASGTDARCVVFSAAGFSESLLEAEETDPELVLVDLETVAGLKPAPPLRRTPAAPEASRRILKYRPAPSSDGMDARCVLRFTPGSPPRIRRSRGSPSTHR